MSKSLDFLKSLLLYETDDCITWPFAKHPDGRGIIRYLDYQKAHEAMCHLKYGPKPNSQLIVRHSCNNGHLACVNPKHVSWSTRMQNGIDRATAGKYKLTEQDVIEIRKSKATLQSLADCYGAAIFAIRLAQGRIKGRLRSFDWVK